MAHGSWLRERPLQIFDCIRTSYKFANSVSGLDLKLSPNFTVSVFLLCNKFKLFICRNEKLNLIELLLRTLFL